MADIVFLAVAAIIVAIAVIFIVIYNNLISLKHRIENAWSQIDVQLKRRTDLVPNLIETVKGYAAHEKNVFENVTKARSMMMGAQNVKEKADASNMLTGALKSLFAVAENYPQLRANENFLQLQEELSGIESKIAYSRQFYNDSVMNFNVAIQQFPSNAVASMFGMKEAKEYFQIEETEKAVPKVQF